VETKGKVKALNEGRYAKESVKRVTQIPYKSIHRRKENLL
jgi:hypothetical protein